MSFVTISLNFHVTYGIRERFLSLGVVDILEHIILCYGKMGSKMFKFSTD